MFFHELILHRCPESKSGTPRSDQCNFKMGLNIVCMCTREDVRAGGPPDRGSRQGRTGATPIVRASSRTAVHTVQRCVYTAVFVPDTIF